MFIFDHMAKCAGQSIRSILASSMPSLPVSHSIPFAKNSDISWLYGQFYIVCSHIAFSGEGLLKNHRYFTVIREPLDRLLSFVSYVLSNDDTDLVSHPLSTLRNSLLVFNSSSDAPVDEVMRHFLGDYYVKHFSSITHPDCDSDIDLALHNLLGYDAFGVVLSIHSLITHMQGLIDPNVRLEASTILKMSVNVTPKKSAYVPPSNTHKRALATLIEKDVLFYEKALRFLNQDYLYIRSSCRTLSHDLASFSSFEVVGSLAFSIIQKTAYYPWFLDTGCLRESAELQNMVFSELLPTRIFSLYFDYESKHFSSELFFCIFGHMTGDFILRLKHVPSGKVLTESSLYSRSSGIYSFTTWPRNYLDSSSRIEFELITSSSSSGHISSIAMRYS